MIFHFTVFFYTLLFFLGLEIITAQPSDLTWGWYVLTATPLIVVSFVASKRLTKKWTDASLLVLLSLVSPVLLTLIDRPAERQVFSVISALMYYAGLLGIYRLRHSPRDETARTFLHTSALAGMFFFYAGTYGFYLNFSFPLWGLMVLYGLGTAFTSFETFVGEEKKERFRVFLYSLLLGLLMGELVWVMSLWPFGYLTTGAIALILYYILWEIAYDSFARSLSLKKTIGRILVLVLLVVMLLLSTPWRIAI